MAEPKDTSSLAASPQGQTGQLAGVAADKERERIGVLEADADRMKREAQKRIEAAEQRAREIEAKNEADQKAELDRQKRLIEQAKAATKRGKSIPVDVVKEATDKDIQHNLMVAAIAQDFNLEFEEKRKKAALNLAQLAKMAGIALQAGAAMTSLSQTPSGISAPSSNLTALAPSEKGKSQITSKSDDDVDATDAKADPNQLDDETIQKIKIAVADAEKRKEIYSKKHGLRDKLREQMAAKAKRGLASTEGVDTDSLFGGNLNAYQEEAAQAEPASPTAKEDESFGYNAFQAMKAGFGLAGEETDREVDRMVAEAEGTLGSPNAKAGILGTESMSLFQRVKLAHDNCVREKCVLLSGAK
jgi:hypothetical protein